MRQAQRLRVLCQIDAILTIGQGRRIRRINEGRLRLGAGVDTAVRFDAHLRIQTTSHLVLFTVNVKHAACHIRINCLLPLTQLASVQVLAHS